MVLLSGFKIQRKSLKFKAIAADVCDDSRPGAAACPVERISGGHLGRVRKGAMASGAALHVVIGTAPRQQETQ